MKKLVKVTENHQMNTLFDVLGTCGGCGPCGCSMPSYCAGETTTVFFSELANHIPYYEASYRNSYGTGA